MGVSNKSKLGIWLGLIAIAILAGLVAAVQLFIKGHYLFNTNDVILWSLPLGVYIFLALTSSGLTLLASIPLVFDVKKYMPVAKRLVFLAIATLVGAFVSIGLELGNVFHMIYIMISPRFSSPIWWMGAIYSVELVLLIVKFWKMHAGDWEGGFSRALGIGSFLCALVAPLMIGSVFGLTESRVTYFGPIMSIYCLLMALMSGAALCLFYNLVLALVRGEGVDQERTAIWDDFARMFTWALGTMTLFTLVKLAIESATTIPDFLSYRRFGHTFGTIGAVNTEVLFGLFVPFVMMAIPAVRTGNANRIVASGLALLGALAMHVEILLAGQSRPIGPKAEQFPEFVSYFPSVHEWLVLVLAVAVALLLYTLGERYLKLEAAPEH